MRLASMTVIGLLLGLATAPAIAIPGVHLTDNDAIFDYALTPGLPTVSNGLSGNAPMNFQLGGPWLAANTNWIYSGNWFYRFDNAFMERQLADVNGNATMSLTGTNQVRYDFPELYSGPASGPGTAPAKGILVPDTRAWMEYAVFDTGVDRAKMRMDLCVENYGTQIHTIELFAVLDLDVSTTPNSDTYGPLAINGSDRLLSASDGLGLMRMVGHGADIGYVGSISQTLTQMTDLNVDNFFDFPGVGGFAAGSTDAVGVMQYNKPLPPGAVVCSDVEVDIEIVPEPATLALLAAGGLLLRRRLRA